MPCTPEMQFPGAWPESPLPLCQGPSVMDLHVSPLDDSPAELHRPSSPSFSGGSATRAIRKPRSLRIVVPPTEYCPFSTDLTLPSTPHSLPTPVSSSCFTFSDRQELTDQCMSAPPIPGPAAPSCPRITTTVDFASPTSSQFLLMPPTPHLDVNDTAICVSPLVTAGTTTAPMLSGPRGAKSGNLHPWKVSSSTWLSDLGGYTETDRIFRHNLLQMTLADTESSPASTPALSPSGISPSSQISSVLAYNSPTSVVRSPAPSPAMLSPCPCTMSPPSLPARLVLKPMGTDTFPSSLDSLQAWREGVTPGPPRSEEPPSPVSEVVHGSQLGEPTPDTPISLSLPSHQLPSHHLPPPVSQISRSKSFVKHAKVIGGRIKRFVTRQDYKHRSSMDDGVNFRVVSSQDSEHGSVILITAPPPPYESRPPTLVSHDARGQEHLRSRTISEYSSAVQTSTVELVISGMTEPSSRQGGSRNTLRRLSLAALSTIKR